MTGLVDDDSPFDVSEEAIAEWEEVQAEWIAAGFSGGDPAFPVAQDEPHVVDEGVVIVEPDEVKAKAKASSGRKEVWTYTAVVLVELGSLCGERRLLILGDGACWIRTWFEGLGIDSKAMVLCWWHLRSRCYDR